MPKSGQLPSSWRSEAPGGARTASRRLASVWQFLLVTGGRYEVRLEAHRVDSPCRRCCCARGVGTNVSPRRSASAQGRGSWTRTRTRLRLAARILPVEKWRLRLERGRLGSSPGEACAVGTSSLGSQSARLVQHRWTLG